MLKRQLLKDRQQHCIKRLFSLSLSLFDFSMEEGGFTLIGKKGRPCKAYRKEAVNAKAARTMKTATEEGEGIVILPCTCESSDARIKSVNKRLTKAISTLRTNGYWDALKASFGASAAAATTTTTNDFHELISYGIGNFCCTRISLLQFAVFLLIKEELCEPDTVTSAYDPAFGEVCKGVCALRGVTVIEKDERAAHPCTEPTLFYMPHCDLFMYENVISANWIKNEKKDDSEEGEKDEKATNKSGEEYDGYVDPKITIIGNSFLSYIERFDSVAAKKNPHISSCESCLVEKPIVFAGAADSNTMNAFNNTSVHRFVNKSN